jgi:hypothetical protein
MRLETDPQRSAGGMMILLMMNHLVRTTEAFGTPSLLRSDLRSFGSFPKLKFRWRPIKGVGMDGDGDENIQELYRQVAANDPEWFEAFVADVLGDDQVDPELVQLARDSRQQFAVVPEASKATTIDADVVASPHSSSSAPTSQPDPAKVESIGTAQNGQPQKSTSVATAIPSLSISANTVEVETAMNRDESLMVENLTTNVIVDTTKTTTGSVKPTDDNKETGLTGNNHETLISVPNSTISIPNSTINKAVRQQESDTSSPEVSKALVTSVATTEIAIKHEHNDTVVSEACSVEEAKNSTKLNTFASNSSVNEIAQAMYENETIEKQKDASRVSATLDADDEWPSSSVVTGDDSKPIALPVKNPRLDNSTKNSLGKEKKESGAHQNNPLVATEKKTAKPDGGVRRGDDDQPADTPTRATTTNTDFEEESNLIISYFCPTLNVWQKVPLSKMIELGYTQKDVISLEADALELIIEEQVRKPSGGIPVRWKVPKGRRTEIAIQNAEMNLLSEEADKASNDQPPISHRPAGQLEEDIKGAFMANPLGKERYEESSTRDSTGSSKPAVAKGTKQESTGDATGKYDRNVPGDQRRTQTTTEGNSGPRPRVAASSSRDGSSIQDETKDGNRRRRPPPGIRRGDEFLDESRATAPHERAENTDRRQRPRPRERRSSGESRREKTIYSGRGSQPSKQRARDDPPSSSSGVWPDMDTFRRLLRNEAGLRLKILGDDWADVVKEESDWRLNLYKDWLWTVHNGIGRPVVESRSDRMRRQRKFREEVGPPPRRSSNSRSKP